MKVVDARSGRAMTPGQRVDYGDGEYLELLDVEPGLFFGRALIRHAYRDMSRAPITPATRFFGTASWNDRGEARQAPVWIRSRAEKLSAPLVVGPPVWAPLTVRWLHPKYPLQHVGFIPS